MLARLRTPGPRRRRLAAVIARTFGRLVLPLGVAALLFLPALALFFPQTLGGRTLIPYDALATDPVFRPALQAAGVGQPQNDLVADLVFENGVWKAFFFDQVKQGRLPLWNPYAFGGSPFLAGGQHGGFYPPSWLFLVLPSDAAFGWVVVLNLWLAGLSMYALGRSLKLRRPAATMMGLAWSLGSLMVTNTVFPMIQGAMAFTPLLLAGIERLAERARPDADWLPHGITTVWAVVAALATWLIAVAGHVEMLYYAALVASAYSLFRLVQTLRVHGRRSAAKLAAWLAGAAATGGLMAAVQLLPLAEVARTNWRSGSEPYDVIAGYAFGLRQAITFLVPDFYGNPAHHAVWDVAASAAVPLAGHTMWGAELGTKNYVEAASYLGILPLLLALAGVLVGLVWRRRRGEIGFWTALGAVSLSFVFGLPTYRLLFFGLPGIDQLHTPFRWVFPFALAAVVLAGFGADALTRLARPPDSGDDDEVRPEREARTHRSGRSAPAKSDLGPTAYPGARVAAFARAAAGLGWLAVGAAILLGGILAAAYRVPARWVEIVGRFVPQNTNLNSAIAAHFPTLGTFAFYEFWNLVHLAIFLALGGAAIVLATRAGAGSRTAGQTLWPLALLLGGFGLVADLATVGAGFNPAVDPRLGQSQPEVVRTLADLAGEGTDIKWGRVVGFGDDKVLWPNSAWRFGIPDLRGYDSIIPRWSVETLNALEDQSGMLTYNRIGNLHRTESLRRPLLKALGGRYILTTQALDFAELPELKLLIHAGSVRLYENTAAMPRAWIVDKVSVLGSRAELLASLAGFDPAREVLVEQPPDPRLWTGLPQGRSVRPASTVSVTGEAPGDLKLDVFSEQPGMLVLSETWFPGWRAFVQSGGGRQATEHEVPIYRADGMLQAVPVPSGRSLVTFRYFPMSVKLGLYFSFLGLVVLFLLVAYALWRPLVRRTADDHVGRVAANTAGPTAAQVVNKALLFVFAMLTYRVLSPAAAGQYGVAITLVGLLEIVTNFGLNLLVARDVARRPEAAGRYLTHVVVIRLALCFLVVPLAAAYVASQSLLGHPLERDTVLAIGLLLVGLLPSNVNAALTSLFQAREQMNLPAAVTIISTLSQVALGALALVFGYGFVGLAAVSIVTNVIALTALAILARRAGIRPDRELSRAELRRMTVDSWPLMLNHLLQTLFFKVDLLVLQFFSRQQEIVGWYRSAYTWIDTLLIVPQFSVMALLPLMSRRAEGDREGLRRVYIQALRWLIFLALPICVSVTVLAEGLIGLLGGPEYLPHGAIALAIMVWFLPWSYANGLIQYVLVAIGETKAITRSFVAVVLFNLVANLVVIPIYSYKGAAAVTIVSELVLMVPFLRALRPLDVPSPLVFLWRPALASGGMLAVIAGTLALGLPPLVGVILGLPVYLVVLVRLGAVTKEDRQVLARVWGRG